MELLDVGGGFPGTDDFTGQNISFEEIAAVLSKALEEHFPSRDVRVIAEPGRYEICFLRSHEHVVTMYVTIIWHG